MDFRTAPWRGAQSGRGFRLLWGNSEGSTQPHRERPGGGGEERLFSRRRGKSPHKENGRGKGEGSPCQGACLVDPKCQFAAGGRKGRSQPLRSQAILTASSEELSEHVCFSFCRLKPSGGQPLCLPRSSWLCPYQNRRILDFVIGSFKVKAPPTRTQRQRKGLPPLGLCQGAHPGWRGHPMGAGRAWSPPMEVGGNLELPTSRF